MSPDRPSTWFLFDNGSLRADSTLSLRKLAAALASYSSQRIEAVSLLHSSNVPANALNGAPARLLEPALVEHLTATPDAAVGLLPLFFGPSGALTDYLPARLKSLQARFPRARITVAKWLIDPSVDDNRLALILADRVRATLRENSLSPAKVVLVDHGSPQPAVTAVRDYLGRQLQTLLGKEVECVGVASMERREGEAYAFNEPLLAGILRTPAFHQGNVVIALQFLSPGRHAGPGGDIAEICSAAEVDLPGLVTQMTEPIANDPRLVELLAERMAQAING